jgi:hypothetical protein
VETAEELKKVLAELGASPESEGLLLPFVHNAAF